MYITHPENKRIKHDWEFSYVSGMTRSATLDYESGDKVEETQTEFAIYLAPKKSKDGSRIIPSEHIRVFKTHLADVVHREREELGLTPDQEAEWNKTVQELSKGGKNVH